MRIDDATYDLHSLPVLEQIERYGPHDLAKLKHVVQDGFCLIPHSAQIDALKLTDIDSNDPVVFALFFFE